MFDFRIAGCAALLILAPTAASAVTVATLFPPLSGDNVDLFVREEFSTVFPEYPFANGDSVTSATITIEGTYNYALTATYFDFEDGEDGCFVVGGPLSMTLEGETVDSEFVEIDTCVSPSVPTFATADSLDFFYSQTFLPGDPLFDLLISSFGAEFRDQIGSDLERTDAIVDYSFDFIGLITVEYDVPAPATAALFALGLAGLAAARRRAA